MPDIVNAVFLKSGMVLLARRSPARKSYPGLWSFPGGHVELGEGHIQALTRETREEVGVVPVKAKPLELLRDPSDGEIFYYLFAVSEWDGELSIQDDEHSELQWFALDAAGRLPDLALEAYRDVFFYVVRAGLAD